MSPWLKSASSRKSRILSYKKPPPSVDKYTPIGVYYSHHNTVWCQKEGAIMDYQEMYASLFNKITDVIADLQKIQRETETMYISSNLDEEENIPKC